jgi:drug/metabolite transporter (DMT)-like permease
MSSATFEHPGISLNQGRLFVLAAAILWSLGGFFSKVLTKPYWLGVHEPKVEPLQMAFFRVLFAGLFLLPLVRRNQVRLRLPMFGMALTFAAMNAMYVSALVLGTAANAILLQYTAPLWMYLACIWILKEPADRRNSVALCCGLAGVAVLLAGGWQGGQETVILLGLGSGVTFGAIMIFLRVLRSEASAWLTVWNHLATALILAPFALVSWQTMTFIWPTWPQLGVLCLFGVVQMGFPYFLMARGLRVVSPQEAGAITLLEPLLNPLWAYLVSPETETPGLFTVLGGVLILSGLAWRYWPLRRS